VPYFLPVGGSTPLGCLGFVEGALELAEQVDAGVLPEPSHVVVPLGSGGTAAGLVAGLRLAGMRTRVAGIVVNDKTPVNASVVARLAGRTLRLLSRRGASLTDTAVAATDLDVESAWLGEGYGHRTPAAERTRTAAAEREALELDPVYTAKTMTGVLALRERAAFGAGPVLFWQTHDTMMSAAS
jgi:D-cysteine desulfhydrase